MSDEHIIVLAAAVLMASNKHDANSPECIRIARELFSENRKLGPVGYRCEWCMDTKTVIASGKPVDCPRCVTRKATLSHPTVADRNEAHAEREYNKRMGK